MRDGSDTTGVVSSLGGIGRSDAAGVSSHRPRRSRAHDDTIASSTRAGIVLRHRRQRPRRAVPPERSHTRESGHTVKHRRYGSAIAPWTRRTRPRLPAVGKGNRGRRPPTWSTRADPVAVVRWRPGLGLRGVPPQGRGLMVLVACRTAADLQGELVTLTGLQVDDVVFEPGRSESSTRSLTALDGASRRLGRE
jgi:hypothetical protein